MNDGSRLGRALLLAWAIAATFVGVVSSGLALYFFLHRGASSARTTAAASPFLELREESVPGTYKWTEKGKESPITLFPDHSFSGAFGRRTPDHRWVITRDSLWIIWNNKTDKFNVIESPGVYVGVRDDGTPVRMEKVP
jgi:hypothetical protein